MGNAVVFATSSSSVPVMLETTCDEWVKLLTDLAIKVHRARRGISKEYVEGLVSNINDAKDWGDFVFEIPEVLVNNMRHMKVYDLDFGSVLGTVDTFKIHNAGIKGGCWIMPDRKGMPENTLKREFIVAIEPEAMGYLDKDPLLHWLSGGNSSKL
ncbi:hypothetical protein PENSTE_c011G05971 [Penicillium steckii]|uniref:Uncharacterized protein n=1 Tax=Penicillium steckii TaxID=303698 RepID=A0A1V6T7B1_9EURO|nr:hypothetical protein PENSTE_c011G05971 [Penicillium steckii]